MGNNYTMKCFFNLPSFIYSIANLLSDLGFKPILVGGAVRDHLLAKPCRDYDIEVFDCPSLDLLVPVLKQFGSVCLIGKSFSVVTLRINHLVLDFSLPRIDIKSGKKHNDFNVLISSKLSYSEAASRRDFTINSMGYDLINHVLIDPYDGFFDLNQRLLRHIAPSFIDDPLRVLRAAQISSRYGLSLDLRTINMCRSIDLSEISKERYYGEFQKLILKS
tara:strand:+ start:225 stop:881 length:657 start_codon:yes stop_codon:yes gene_type:complete